MSSTRTKPEFSLTEKEELKALREYVEKLRELEAALKTEFPNVKRFGRIALALESAAEKIAEYEMARIEAELPGELPR